MSTKRAWDVILCQMLIAIVSRLGKSRKYHSPAVHGIIWDLHEGAADLAIAICPH